ncbi:hypothetical protein BBOV_I001730 [Babesia bovis T2Bo]|uniref:Uncharacterized protein n=1 Tax=Babesia bovis TaxID=5865 RepID=A7AW29_BABBO|nr:hypothetical protein BBOV_I001730 [Babesia bovis T2Bo]EDO05257.1 hypothetical protein BBOV_I001730 [Babesia bovis T2Bo]|eukprot:XP_001608825.1 hypothetical protein [Babesia bovis T2Bo]
MGSAKIDENIHSIRTRIQQEASDINEENDITTTQNDNGPTWLERILGRLDANKKIDKVNTIEADEQSESSSYEESDDSETYEAPQLSRKTLEYKDLLCKDLSNISKLIKKSHFCHMEVGEEDWPEYKEFMYKNYRSKLNKIKRQAQRRENNARVGVAE